MATRMLVFSAFLSLFSAFAIVSGLAIEPRQTTPYTYRNCLPSQEILLDKYVDDMVELAKAAITLTEDKPANTDSDWYKAWWGTYNPDRSLKMLQNEKINTRYEKLSAVKNIMSDRSFSCDNNAESDCCKAGYSPAACLNGRGQQRIFICPSFWKMEPQWNSNMFKQSDYTQLNIDAWRTRGSILLHELTHSWFSTFDQTWKENGRDETAYGHGKTLQYTLTNPVGARLNADHYAMFALAAYYGNGHVDRFATNPDNVLSGPPKKRDIE